MIIGTAAPIRTSAGATGRSGEDAAVPTDVYAPRQQTEAGIYRPFLPPAANAARSARLAEDAWKQLAVLDPTSKEKRYSLQTRERARVLGEPRLNRVYPDPDLEKAGVDQSLPMDVKTPFKWLLSKPLVLGENGDVVLLPAQHEGGPTWLGEELECRDLFIALKLDRESGRYREIGALQTKPSEYAYVFRSVGPVETVPATPNRFLVHLEEGTYNSGIFARHTHLYEVTGHGIQQVGYSQGHTTAADVSSL
ncbi:MAG: hypothetical protein HY319_08850 [Armatimonadetes bacterium]|nr:hypothetical protein [Armatimonadota bacterium]